MLENSQEYYRILLHYFHIRLFVFSSFCTIDFFCPPFVHSIVLSWLSPDCHRISIISDTNNNTRHFMPKQNPRLIYFTFTHSQLLSWLACSRITLHELSLHSLAYLSHTHSHVCLSIFSHSTFVFRPFVAHPIKETWFSKTVEKKEKKKDLKSNLQSKINFDIINQF